ncbi:DUF6230 family protein [Klenkia sp. LSe6-5]|uniref:DUF6230 family protein n=1 Tax=Klenkia sesuvii TaxID=3103137 RepID=A0ABU8DUI6_9ACTN
MKEAGTGRVRIGRFTAVTVPAAVVSVGFGYAILQGMVAAQLSSVDPFTVSADQARATGLELSLRQATTASGQDDTTEDQKKSALVTLNAGEVDQLCLAANQPVPVLGNIGLRLTAGGTTSLGDVDISADAIEAGSARLPQTSIGVAQSTLDHQSTVANGYRPGGFGLEANGPVVLNDLDTDAYALSLESLNFGQGLTITPQLGTATC